MRLGGQNGSPNINALSIHRLFSSSTPFHAHFISTAASKAPESPGSQPSCRHSQIQFSKAFTFTVSVKSSLMSHCLKAKSGHLCSFSVVWLQNLPMGGWSPFPRHDFSIQLIHLPTPDPNPNFAKTASFLNVCVGPTDIYNTIYL